MLESVLAVVLNKTIGWLIEDVNSNDLNLAVSKGDVVLHNLSVRKDAFASKENPLIIKSGKISKLRLVIPWSNVSKSPTILELDGLDIRLEIKRENVERKLSDTVNASLSDKTKFYDEEAKARKLKLIEQVDGERRARIDTFEKSKEGEQQSSSWFSRYVSDLTKSIAENLRVSIRNVRLEVSHPSSDPGRSFCMGLLLEAFTLLPDLVNAKDQNSRPRTRNDAARKAGRLQGLKIYYGRDISATNGLDLFDPSTFFFIQDNYRASVDSGVASEAPVQILIEEPDLSLSVPEFYLEPVKDTPMITVTATVESVEAKIEYHQFHDVMKLISDLNAEMAFIESQGVRPITRPNLDPKGWWRYSILRVLENYRDLKSRSSWGNLGVLFQKRSTYLTLYKRQFIANGPSVHQLSINTAFGGEDKAMLEQLELELPVASTMMFRTTAEFELVHMYKLTSNAGFAQRWIGLNNSERYQMELSSRDTARRLALEFLDFVDVPDKSKFLYDISFTLTKSRLVLGQRDANIPLLELSLTYLFLTATKRGAEAVTDLQVLDIEATNGLSGNKVLSFYTDVSTRRQCLALRSFSSVVEDAPDSIDIEVHPLQIWIDADFLRNTLGFLQPPDYRPAPDAASDESFDEFFLLALERVRRFNFGHRTDAFRSFKPTKVTIKSDHPIIVFPAVESPDSHRNSDLETFMNARDALVVEVEEITVQSANGEVGEKLLAGYEVAFRNFKISLDRALPSSSALLTSQESVRRTLLEKTNFYILQQTSICPCDPTVPLDVKQVVFESTIRVNVSAKDIQRANKLKASIDQALSGEPRNLVQRRSTSAAFIHNVGVDYAHLQMSLEPKEIEMLSEMVASNLSLSFSSIVISLLDEVGDRTITKFGISGNRDFCTVRTQSKIGANLLSCSLPVISLFEERNNFHALYINDLQVSQVDLSYKRPCWFEKCPPLESDYVERPKQQFREPELASNFRNINVSISEINLGTQEMFINELLQFTHNMLKGSVSSNPVPTNQDPPQAQMVTLWVPTVNVRLTDVDYFTQLCIVELSDIDLSIKDIPSESRIDESFQTEEGFALWAGLNSIRVADGSDCQESIAWNTSQWGEEIGGDNFCNVMVRRPSHSWNDKTEPFQVIFNVQKPRLSLSAPLLSIVVGHVLKVMPPPDEDAEPLKLPTLQLKFNMNDLVVMIPRCPEYEDSSWMGDRSLIVFRVDTFDMTATHRELHSPDQIDEELASQSVSLEHFSSKKLLGHSGSTQEFFDAKSDFSDADEIIVEDEQPLPDIALTVEISASNLSLESWLFEDDLFQCLLRTSVVGSIDWSPIKNLVWLQVTPVIINCSQVQYAALLDTLEFNPLQSIIPTKPPVSPSSVGGESQPSTRQGSLKSTVDPDNEGSETGSDQIATLTEIFINLTFEEINCTLFREDGGERLPKVSRGFNLVSLSEGGLNSTPVLWVAKSSASYKMLAVLLSNANLIVKSDTFPRAGEGTFSMESLKIATFVNSEEVELLRTDRNPFWIAEFRIDGVDDYSVVSTLAQIELDSFELFSSWSSFSRVESFSIGRHRVETSTEPGDHESHMSYDTTTTGSTTSTDLWRKETSYRVQPDIPTKPQRIMIPKSFSASLVCERFRVALTPTKSPVGLVFAGILKLQANAEKEKELKTTLGLLDFQLMRCKFSNSVAETQGCSFVVKPFNISASLFVKLPLARNQGSGIDSSDDIVFGTVDVGSINVDVGRDDYTLIMTSSIMNGGQATSAVQSGHKHDLEYRQDDVRETASLFSRLISPPLAKRKVTVTFELRSCSFTLLQDWEELCPPIARMQIHHCRADLQQYDSNGSHSQQRIDVNIGFECKFWNRDQGLWESLLEPFFLRISLDLPEFMKESAQERIVKTLQYLKSDPVKPVTVASQFLRVESPQMLNINVTPTGLRQLDQVSILLNNSSSASSQRSFLHHDSGSVRDSAVDSAQLFVRNEAGVDVLGLLFRSSRNGRQVLDPANSDHASAAKRFVGCWAWKSDPTGLLWKKRFIVVQGGSVKYFKSMDRVERDQPSGIIPLTHKGIYMKSDTIVGKECSNSRNAAECAFQLVTPSRTYNFVTGNLVGKEKLMGSILAVLTEISWPNGKADAFIDRVSRIRLLFPPASDEEMVMELNAYMLSIYELKGFRISSSGNFDEEEKRPTPIASLDISRFCHVELSTENPLEFKLVGPTFHLDIREVARLKGPLIPGVDDVSDERQTVVDENGGNQSNSTEPRPSRSSSLSIEGTTQSGLFQLLRDRIKHREASFERNRIAGIVNSEPHSGTFQITLTFLSGSFLSLLRQYQIEYLRVWILPSGQSMEIDLTRQSESTSPQKVQFNIASYQRDCQSSQVIRFDLLSPSGRSPIAATGHAVILPIVNKQDLEREINVSFHSIGGKLGVSNSESTVCQAALEVHATRGLCSDQSRKLGAHFEMNEIHDVDQDYVRIPPAQEVGLNQMAGPQHGDLYLSLKTENVELEPVPTKTSGRFALPLGDLQSSEIASSQLDYTKTYLNSNLLPKFLVCDLHFEEGTKICTVRSNASIKNRLQKTIQLTFCRLFANEPCASPDLSSKFWLDERAAFDGKVETYWTGNLADESVPCRVQYRYVDELHRRVMIYSVASPPYGHAPSDWVLEGLTKRNRDWVVLDEQSEIHFTKSRQLRSFSVARPESCSAFRLTFTSSLPMGKQTQDIAVPSNVSVGNIILYSQEQVEKHRQLDRGPMLSLRFEPGQTTSIPVEVLANGGAVRFGSGSFMLLEEILHINPWKVKSTYKRAKPRFLPVMLDNRTEFCNLHLSFHRLHDVAKTSEQSDNFSPFWVMTLDPPVVIENLLPFPLHYKAVGRVQESTGGGQMSVDLLDRRSSRQGQSNSFRATSPTPSGPGNVLVEMCRGKGEVVVGRGNQSHCLYIDPSKSSTDKVWTQRVANVFTIDSVLAQFAVKNIDRHIRCAEEEAPIIFGEGLKVSSKPLEVGLEGTDLKLLVEIVAKKRDDIDPDHQHFHETGVVPHQSKKTNEGNGTSGKESADSDEEEEPDLFDAFDVASSGLEGLNASFALTELRDESSILQPRIFHRKCYSPIKIVFYCPVLILNWSGLPLSYSGDDKRSSAITKQRRPKKVAHHSVSQAETSSLTAEMAKTGMSSIVRIEMYSAASEKMSISLKHGAAWSRRFGLAIGMSGEVTIPPTPDSDIIHQVGVSIASAPGKYLRTKVVTITPRFVVVNKTGWPLALAQDGAEKGTWQFTLPQYTLGPFHPIDVNGDGELDDKDFSVRLGIFSVHDRLYAESKSFRIDVVHRHILKLRSPDDDGRGIPNVISCTEENCFSEIAVAPKEEHFSKASEHYDILVVSNELVENVVRVIISDSPVDREFDYRVDNLCASVRVALVQKACKQRTAQVVEPGIVEVEWVWEDSTGSHFIEVMFEQCGLSEMDNYPRAQRTSVLLDFDRVGDSIRTLFLGMEIDLIVKVEGLTKVLVIDDMVNARNLKRARRILQDRLSQTEEQLLSARRLLNAGLRPLSLDPMVQSSVPGAEMMFDGKFDTFWSASKRPTEEFVVFSFSPFTHSVDAYGFTVRRSRSTTHPRVWRLYGQTEENGIWHLLDSQNFHGRKADISFFDVSSEDEPDQATIFRLNRRSSPCFSFKLVVESPFKISSFSLYVDGKRPTEDSHETRPLKHLWLCLAEARDLPVMDLYSSDPYAVIRVGESGRRVRSKVINKSLHPIFDQEFSLENVSNDSFLYLEMFDKDVFSRDDFMGQASFRIGAVCNRGEPADIWVKLQDKNGHERGQVRLVVDMLDRPLSGHMKYLNVIRFPRLFVSEVEHFQRLQMKLEAEGGVFEQRQDKSFYRTQSVRANYVGGFETKKEEDNTSSVNQEQLVDQRLKLCITVLGADGILSPPTWVNGRLKEIYCVVSYGDRSLRTDPVAVTPGSSDSQLRAIVANSLVAPGKFLVQFEREGPLGIQFERLPSGEFVVLSVASDSPARKYPRIVPGVTLVRLQNTEISQHWRMQAVRDILSTAPRPLRITFDDATTLCEGKRERTRDFATSPDFPRCNVSWMQQLTFDVSDTVRALAKEQTGRTGSELEHRRARVAVYVRDPAEEPSLDICTESSENHLLIPLLYMFGEDVEVDSEIRTSQEKFGDCDILLGETTVLLPDLHGAVGGATEDTSHTRSITCPLEFHGVIGAGSLRLQVGWSVVEKSPAECILRGIEVRLKGVGVSLVDTAVRKCELAYLSLQDIRLYIGNHLDGRQVFDLYAGQMQIDNQMYSAVHPIVLCAAPLPFPWLVHAEELKEGAFLKTETDEYAHDLHRSPPAILMTLVIRNSSQNTRLTYVEFFDFYLQEINLKLEERWLTAIQDFVASLDRKESDVDSIDFGSSANQSFTDEEQSDEGSAALSRHESEISTRSARSYEHRAQESVKLKEVIWKTFTAQNPMSWISDLDFGDDEFPGSTNHHHHKHGGSANEEHRILVERADVKPIRINLTFSMTSDQEKKMENRLKILHLLQGIPILAAFTSALVNTVANISDAPLRFNSLQVFNQGMSFAMLKSTMQQHLASQLFSNLAQMGNLIASADLLGSPVKLLGSFGKGAYSFFYEPALALSMNGYLGVGQGLFKGGGELVRGTTHGLSYSLQKFAESASRALAQASLDSNYILREARMRTDVVHEPINIAEGFEYGLQAFLGGLLDAFVGVGLQPYRGARKKGASGLIAGAGKGLLGVLIKPLCAFFDAAGLFLQGLTNTTETLARQQIPVRLRRFVGPNLSVEAYSAREAIGAYVLSLSRLNEYVLYLFHEHVVAIGTTRVGLLGKADFDSIIEEHENSAEEEASGTNHACDGREGILFLTNKFILFRGLGNAKTIWSVPCNLLSGIEVRGCFIKFEIGEVEVKVDGVSGGFRMGFVLRCRNEKEAFRLTTLLNFTCAGEVEACRATALQYDQQNCLETGILALTDPAGALEMSRRARHELTAILHHLHDPDIDSALASSEHLFDNEIAKISHCLSFSVSTVTTRGDARRILGMRLRKAVITGRSRFMENGSIFVAYRTVVASGESDECWVVWRRYSAFRKLRDDLTKNMKKSRTSLPLPSRHPWRLSSKGLNQRQLGLNRMLQTLFQVDTLRDSPITRAFLTSDVDQVSAGTWEDLLQNEKSDDARSKRV